MLALLDRLGLRDEFPSSVVLELGAERDRLNLADIETDPLVAEIFGAAREVLWFLAEHLDAYDFFVETQRIGVATGVIYTPGEAIADPHFVARGFPVEIEHPELERSFTYPGAPVPLHRRRRGRPAGPRSSTSTEPILRSLNSRQARAAAAQNRVAAPARCGSESVDEGGDGGDGDVRGFEVGGVADAGEHEALHRAGDAALDGVELGQRAVLVVGALDQQHRAR